MSRSLSIIDDPIIVLGMHRSGTTVLVKLLEELGFFAGLNKDQNHEAIFFHTLNEWFLRRSGGAWDYPSPVKAAIGDNKLFFEMVEVATSRILSNHFNSFSGGRLLKSPWGWKDPRNIFLFPLWKTIFPNCKIIYILRNGVDVANSLHIRALKEIRRDKTRFFEPIHFKRRIANIFKRFETYHNVSARCTHLYDAYLLWEEYLKESERIYNVFNGYKLKIKYENLINSPYEEVENLCKFLNINIDSQKYNNVISHIHKDMAYRFLHDKDLLQFYLKVSRRPMMGMCGYGSVYNLQ